MNPIKGTFSFGGIVIGKIILYKEEILQTEQMRVASSKEEMVRFLYAKKCVEQELETSYNNAQKQLGIFAAQIFQNRLNMLKDTEYEQIVWEIIEQQGCHAEQAILQATDRFMKQYKKKSDAGVHANMQSIVRKDIEEQLLFYLKNTNKESADKNIIYFLEHPTIQQLLRLQKQKPIGIVTSESSIRSHLAMIVQEMQIPAVFGVSYTQKLQGKCVRIDGTKAEIDIIDEEL